MEDGLVERPVPLDFGPVGSRSQASEGRADLAVDIHGHGFVRVHARDLALGGEEVMNTADHITF